MENPKFRFYHIPKTGGTSIFGITRTWTNHKRAHPNHNHVRIIKTLPDPDDIAYAVTRHPYSRFSSAFYHVMDACNEKFFYRNAKVSDCDWLISKGFDNKLLVFNNDPNEFLYALMERSSPYHIMARTVFYHFDIFRPQFYWIGDPRTMRIHHSIKFILRQENLEHEFETMVAQPLGQVPEWDNSVNKRITADTIPLTDTSKGLLRKLYPLDFGNFGHEA